MISIISNKELKEIEKAYHSIVNEGLYDETKTDVYNVLDEFKDDMSRGIKRKQWNRIPAKQYAYALKKFSESEPETFVFSERIIDDWLNIIIENTQEIDIISNLTGRNELNGLADIDYYAVREIFPEEFDKSYAELKAQNYDKNRLPVNAAYDTLEKLGFYDWAVMPDGGVADSDNGTGNVEEILETVDFDSSISDKLVAINRCLDVFHQRSDWASAFIEGGKRTLWNISNGYPIGESKENINEDWKNVLGTIIDAAGRGIPNGGMPSGVAYVSPHKSNIAGDYSMGMKTPEEIKKEYEFRAKYAPDALLAGATLGTGGLATSGLGTLGKAALGTTRGYALSKIGNDAGDVLKDAGHEKLGDAAKLAGNVAGLVSGPKSAISDGVNIGKGLIKGGLGTLGLIGTSAAADAAADRFIPNETAKNAVKAASDITLFGTKSPIATDAFKNGYNLIRGTRAADYIKKGLGALGAGYVAAKDYFSGNSGEINTQQNFEYDTTDAENTSSILDNNDFEIADETNTEDAKSVENSPDVEKQRQKIRAKIEELKNEYTKLDVEDGTNTESNADNDDFEINFADEPSVLDNDDFEIE